MGAGVTEDQFAATKKKGNLKLEDRLFSATR